MGVADDTCSLVRRPDGWKCAVVHALVLKTVDAPRAQAPTYFVCCQTGRTFFVAKSLCVSVVFVVFHLYFVCAYLGKGVVYDITRGGF